MQLIDLLIIALALSAGFFGAAYNGAKMLKALSGKALASPLIFTLMSLVLLYIGYLLGIVLKSYFTNYEYHLTFFVLAGLGIKTFLEGTGKKKGHTVYMLEDQKIVFGASIIFSINYLIAGICMFLFIGDELTMLASFSAITLVVSYCGLLLGRAMKYHLSDFVLITSGIMLIAIAAKILMAHTGYI